jgi:hypothetical protein
LAVPAGFQFSRAAALGAVARHVVHFAVMTFLEPAFEMLLVGAQIRAADAGVGKAQFDRPALDIASQRGVVGGSACIGL